MNIPHDIDASLRSNRHAMSATSTPPSRRRWIVLLLALPLLSLIGLIVWNLSRPAVDARVEAIRSKGYPVTLKDLNDSYKWPAYSDNAAFLYTNAFAGLLFTSNLVDAFTGNNWLPARDKRIDRATKA